MSILQTILISAGVLGFFLFAMSLGVIFSNKPLKGSCGGLSKAMGDDCEFCDKKENCRKKVALA